MTATYKLLTGKCEVMLKDLPDNSVDSIVTDPPYHLTSGKKGGTGEASLNLNSPAGRSRVTTGFMGQAWDGGDIAYNVEMWRECLRVLKPGGFCLAFGGSRTYHRMACAIEDAGFEIRDQVINFHDSDRDTQSFIDSLSTEQRSTLQSIVDDQSPLGQLFWTYGSGFPKGLDVAKSIDKMVRGVPQGGADPTSPNHGKFKGGCSEDNVEGRGFGAGPGQFMREAGVSEDRDLVKIARPWSGWNVALKPSHEPICVARKPLEGTVVSNVLKYGTGAINIDGCRVPGESVPINRLEAWSGFGQEKRPDYVQEINNLGRWPANICHDGSDEVIAAFPDAPGQMGFVGEKHGDRDSVNCYGDWGPRPDTPVRGDSGSAARFFYAAKCSKEDRNSGLGDSVSNHPTVKPCELMKFLVRLVTPPGGTVCDPFTGSGTSGLVALANRCNYIGIELNPEYVEMSENRLSMAVAQQELFA